MKYENIQTRISKRTSDKKIPTITFCNMNNVNIRINYIKKKIQTKILKRQVTKTTPSNSNNYFS